MGTFGSGLWGGGSSGTSGGGTAGTPVLSLIEPAYRIAGISQLAGVQSNREKLAEAVPALNRFLSSWNLDGHKIFTTQIEVFPLTADQKIYTIGPGGDFDTDRPVYIKGANILFPTSPVVRREVYILNDDEWREIAVQDITGAPPYQLYYDGSYDQNGNGQIYLRFQPPAGYSLELYSWQRLKSNFTDERDVAVFPDGYEHAIVLNLARHLILLNPHLCGLDMAQRQEVQAEAFRALAALIQANSGAPKLDCEGGLDHDTGYARGWLDGSIR